MTGHGEIRLADDSLAVEATGLFVSLPADQQQSIQNSDPDRRNP